MKNFEERLARLEQLTLAIKSPMTPLNEALTSFEEGIQLAQGLEKELEKMEKKVEILLNPPSAVSDPTFELFTELPKAP
jgi:exodeoxyribonuclease VII small subunit